MSSIWKILVPLALAAALVLGYVVLRRPPPLPPPPLPDLPNLEEETPDGEGPTLPEEERQFLWDVEHRGNLLNAFGFKKVADALRAADEAALSGYLTADFRGGLLNEPTETSARDGVLDVVRREDAGRTPLPDSGATFLRVLLDYRSLFTGKPPKVSLVLKTLLPTDRKTPDGPWSGVAVLRLHGETRPGEPCEVVVLFRYEIDPPTRERFDAPGWLRAATVTKTLVGQSKRFLMAEVGKARGLDATLFHDNWLQPPESAASRHIATGGVFVCDFDRDGFLDLLVTDINRHVLYRGGPGGRFTDVTRAMGLPGLPTNQNALSGTACWIDLDGDGWDDLIFSGRIYRNNEGKGFVDVTGRSAIPLPPDTISLVVADYDLDGRLDLYATRTGTGSSSSWLTGVSGKDAGNRLLRNLGAFRFEDVTERTNASAGRLSSFTAAWLDANNDGKPDLHVINEFGNGVLLENVGGSFRPHALGIGEIDFGTMGVAAGDIDNDGYIDLYCSNMYSKAGTRVFGNLRPNTYDATLTAKLNRFVAGSQLHLNKGDWRFDHAGARLQVHEVGWAYGAALEDLDNDGYLDLYGTAGHISRDRDKPDG